MLLVKTKISPSIVHGIGLFADEDLPRGTVVWKYQEPFDRKWSQEYVDSLPEVARAHILHFCAKLHDDTFLVTGDNDRFWNHSDEPNCMTDAYAKVTVALRDIASGEELTEDYFSYCGNADSFRSIYVNNG